MIISCYRLKPIQLPEKTESRQRVSKAEQQETRKFPEPDPREGFRGVGSPRSNFIFEGSFAEFSSFLRLTANGLAEAYEQTRISWAEVLSLQLSKFPLLRPLPPPSTSKFPSGVPDYNLNRLRFLVSLGTELFRVIATTVLYLIGYFRLVCPMEFGIFETNFVYEIRRREFCLFLSYFEYFQWISRSLWNVFDLWENERKIFWTFVLLLLSND